MKDTQSLQMLADNVQNTKMIDSERNKVLSVEKLKELRKNIGSSEY